MKNELEFAREKLRQYYRLLAYLLNEAIERGDSDAEIEKISDYMLDLINKVRRQIDFFESNNRNN